MHIVEFPEEKVPAGHLNKFSSNSYFEHSNEPSKECSPSGHLTHWFKCLFK